MSFVVALNLEWNDLGPERAALAAIGAELVGYVFLATILPCWILPS
jgi:hypothetical protein